MSLVETTVVLQSAAAVVWVTAGIGACTRRTGANPVDALLGVGLLAGAALLGLDTMGTPGAPLPLSHQALLLCAALALLPAAGARWHAAIAAWPARVLVAMATLIALHSGHVLAPQQPLLELGVECRPLDLLVAAALGWLALRAANGADGVGDGVSGPLRAFLLGGSALGLALGAFAGDSAAAVVAASQLLAAAPWAVVATTGGSRTVPIAAATALAATTALALRAQGGAGPTALLALAAGFVAFGIAVLQRAEDSPATADPDPAPVPSTERRPAAPGPAAPFTLQALGADLRAPLTSMLAAADLLDDSTTREDRAEHLETIQSQGRKLADALGELEDFELLLRGELVFAEDTFDLPELLRCSLVDVTASAAERGIEVRIDLPASLPRWVQGDPARLHQLTSRLLELAVTRSDLGPVDLAASRQGDRLHLLVQNRCPSTHVDELRAGPRETDLRRGIGTLFCRQLALAMNGDLTVREHADGGVSLHLELPLVEAQPWEVEIAEQDAARPAAPAGAEPPAVHGQVLLVEDSRDHQRLVGHLLERAGAHVTTAANGAIALHLLQEQSFDLVLMDMQMPELDGYAATRALRERGVTTPIVALTADVGENTAAQCLAAGCNGHLGKPVERELLQRTLAMYLATPTADGTGA